MIKIFNIFKQSQIPKQFFSVSVYLKQPVVDKSGRDFKQRQVNQERQQSLIERDIKKQERREVSIINDNYKSGYTHELLQDSPDSVKKIFKLQNALPSEIKQHKISLAIKKFQQNPNDTASGAVQVAVLCEKIITLINHVSKNLKDKKSARQLQSTIDQRRKMLNYLRRSDFHYYKWVIAEYNLPDVVPMNAHHKDNMRLYPNKSAKRGKNL